MFFIVAESQKSRQHRLAKNSGTDFLTLIYWKLVLESQTFSKKEIENRTAAGRTYVSICLSRVAAERLSIFSVFCFSDRSRCSICASFCARSHGGEGTKIGKWEMCIWQIQDTRTTGIATVR